MLFFTFSGISGVSAQDPSEKIMPNIPERLPVISKNVKNDSLQVKEKYFAAIIPNPARNKVEIEVKGFEKGFLQVQIFDARDNKLRDDKRLLVSGNEMIQVMFSLQPGLYILLLKQNKKTLKKNLVVH